MFMMVSFPAFTQDVMRGSSSIPTFSAHLFLGSEAYDVMILVTHHIIFLRK